MDKFIDLFCGIGGFRLALQNKGLQCVFSSDIDKSIQEVYYKNFGDRPAGDIKKVSEKEIPRHDILCAGFPCQPFSIAGKKNGIRDHRGRLFYEIVRIAQYHKPCIILLENVKNIVTIDKGKVIQTIEKTLKKTGYTVQRHILNASHFGIPQARERVYLVGLLKTCFKLKYTLPKEERKNIYLENILDKEVNTSLFIKRDDITINTTNIDYKLKPVRVGIINKGGQGERIYSPKGHAITLSAHGGGAGARTGLYFINNKIRKLSINECKKLMGIPTRHIVSKGIKGYQQLGNAVIPKMIEHVYDSIKIEK